MDKAIVPLNVKAISESDEHYTFEGHLAVFDNVDFGFDRIEKGAFRDFIAQAKSKGQENIPALWVHRHAEPIGVMPISEMREDDKGLFVKAYMPKDDTFVSGRVMPQIRVGSVRQMSIGYDTLEWSHEKDVRVLSKLHLWEGSLTPVAMNEQATLTGFKEVSPYGDLPLADRKRPWDATSAIGRVREWAGIDEAGDLSDPDVQRKYRKAFFWFDGAEQDLLGAYKLPFADVINGTLTAIPRGIFAAAAAMRGARGGVDMPSGDRPSVIRNIERYYDKMDLESPFGKSFRIDDITAVDVRDFEKALRAGVRFPAKTAVAIVAAIKAAGLREETDTATRDEETDKLDDCTLNDELDKVLQLFNF